MDKNEEESLISHYTAHLRRLQEDMGEKAIAQITDQRDIFKRICGRGTCERD